MIVLPSAEDLAWSAAGFERDWDGVDEVLYRLCRDHPDHTDRRWSTAKLVLIGRAYSAGLAALPPGEKRIHEAVQANEKVSRNSRDYRVLLEIAAHALTRKDLKAKIASLYANYRDVNRRMLDEQPAPELEGDVDRLAVLSLAITDGLSRQYALDPEEFDPGPYRAYWGQLLSNRLPDHR